MGHFVNQDRERNGRGQVIKQEDAPLQRRTVGRAKLGVREVPVATRRSAASVQEHIGPFWTPEASGKPCAVYRDCNCRPRPVPRELASLSRAPNDLQSASR